MVRVRVRARTLASAESRSSRPFASAASRLAVPAEALAGAPPPGFVRTTPSEVWTAILSPNGDSGSDTGSPLAAAFAAATAASTSAAAFASAAAPRLLGLALALLAAAAPLLAASKDTPGFEGDSGAVAAGSFASFAGPLRTPRLTYSSESRDGR